LKKILLSLLIVGVALGIVSTLGVDASPGQLRKMVDIELDQIEFGAWNQSEEFGVATFTREYSQAMKNNSDAKTWLIKTTVEGFRSGKGWEQSGTDQIFYVYWKSSWVPEPERWLDVDMTVPLNNFTRRRGYDDDGIRKTFTTEYDRYRVSFYLVRSGERNVKLNTITIRP